ncbi:MAG: hypothetical protein JJU29_18915 [Verrucomicrobia bacterium]|nr:hypothetical protein [Verrucomicrobiota bacterium]MCH8514130.1 hypothetical protein [Kiritimatiellia bacterium]
MKTKITLAFYMIVVGIMNSFSEDIVNDELHLQIIQLDNQNEEELHLAWKRIISFQAVEKTTTPPQLIKDAFDLLKKFGPADFDPISVVEYNSLFFFLSDAAGNGVADYTRGYGVVQGQHRIFRWDVSRLPEVWVHQPEYVDVEGELEQHLSKVLNRMSTTFSIRGKFDPPQTSEEAIEVVKGSSNYRFQLAITRITEHEGVYFMSVGTARRPIFDFSRGYAIIKGEREIYQWNFVDDPVGDLKRSGRFNIRPWDEEVKAKIESAVPRMRKLREVNDLFTAPKTIQDAIIFLRRHMGEEFAHVVGAEHDGVFYFSGDANAWRRPSFSFGYAVRKGQRTIFEWDYVEEQVEIINRDD